MPATIFLKDKVIHSVCVGVFVSRNGQFYNYYWYAPTSDELRAKLRRFTNERPRYIIRVKAHEPEQSKR